MKLTKFNKMKKNIILFVIYISYSVCYSQQLTIEETFNYIESIENIYQGSILRYGNKTEKVNVKYKLSEDGILSKQTYYVMSNNETYEEDNIITVHVDDLKREVNYDGDSFIKFKCKTNNCIKEGSRYSNDGLHVFVRQEYEAKKVIKAINYLFSLIDEMNFNRDLDDPFASLTKHEILISNKYSRNNLIKLQESNGTYQIPVSFGFLNKLFILDSGASEITISNTLEKELLKNGLIKKNANLPDALYKIANGNIISQRRILITQLTVGKYTIKNIIASIGNENSPLLLGKNFLDKFKSWSINNVNKTLEILN